MYKTYLTDGFREFCVNHNKVNILNIDSSDSEEDDGQKNNLFEASNSECTERDNTFSELEFIFKQKQESDG